MEKIKVGDLIHVFKGEKHVDKIRITTVSATRAFTPNVKLGIKPKTTGEINQVGIKYANLKFYVDCDLTKLKIQRSEYLDLYEKINTKKLTNVQLFEILRVANWK